MDKMRELKEELKKTSAGRKFLEEAEPENRTDNLIKFAKEQCEIFPKDSNMGMYLRETIKILQAEPCEDAISRADAKKYLSAPDANDDRVIYESDLDLLPSVQPKQKVGHWDDIPHYKDLAWYCSECEHFTTMKHNYCPKCGARMIEPQESEDK